jgi:hypothetical protein
MDCVFIEQNMKVFSVISMGEYIPCPLLGMKMLCILMQYKRHCFHVILKVMAD